MPRVRKTVEDDKLNAFIGAKVAAYREERGLTLAQLGEQVGLSPSHVKGLEDGAYSFTASVLMRLAVALGRPTAAFLPEQPTTDSLEGHWVELFRTLPARDRLVMIELGRKLAGWSQGFVMRFTSRPVQAGGALIALEGIDGSILQAVGRKLADRLAASGPASLCWYDTESELFRYLIERCRDSRPSPFTAFERTLLFSCERLQRQESRIRRELSRGASVVTPFFAMAATVYQKAEGLTDLTIADAVDTLLLRPDLVVLVRSDPAEAVSRAVQGKPRRDQFFSPYRTEEEFRTALTLYDGACEEFHTRGHEILVLDAGREKSLDALAARVVRHLKALATA